MNDASSNFRARRDRFAGRGRGAHTGDDWHGWHRPSATTCRFGSAIARLPLAELFTIEGSIDDGHLVLEGDLRQVRRLGRGMTSGR